MIDNNTLLWRKYEDRCLNEGLSKKRIDKVKYIFDVVLRGVNNKDLQKVTREDLERFIYALNRNEFKKTNGNNYSGASKSDIKKFIRRFWRWFKCNDEVYPPEVAWIKSKISKDERPIEKEIIPFNEVVKLANNFRFPEYKYLVLILYDSGFRIDEMLSVKKKDLTWEEYDKEQKCFWIKCNRSKTITRKIPIPLFTEEIRDFANSTYFKNLKDDDKLFNKEYPAVRKTLNETSERVLGKRVSPHLFRHSSATYWARELEGDMVLLCQRFGWSLSSDEAKTYIRLSGSYEKAAVKKTYSNETSKLKEEVDHLRSELTEFKKYTEVFQARSLAYENELFKIKSAEGKNEDETGEYLYEILKPAYDKIKKARKP